MSGNVSTNTVARWPICRLVMSVSFGLASTQGALSSITANTGVPAVTKRPSWMLSTCVAMPSIGARSSGVVEIALRLFERGRRPA